MSEEVELTNTRTGLAIREFLQKVGEGCSSDFHTSFKKVKEKTSYASCRRYFWILKKLGLIEFTRVEPGKAFIPKRLYRIVPGMEDAEEWRAPQIALYPETRLGSKRYHRITE